MFRNGEKSDAILIVTLQSLQLRTEKEKVCQGEVVEIEGKVWSEVRVRGAEGAEARHRRDRLESASAPNRASCSILTRDVRSAHSHIHPENK